MLSAQKQHQLDLIPTELFLYMQCISHSQMNPYNIWINLKFHCLQHPLARSSEGHQSTCKGLLSLFHSELALAFIRCSQNVSIGRESKEIEKTLILFHPFQVANDYTDLWSLLPCAISFVEWRLLAFLIGLDIEAVPHLSSSLLSLSDPLPVLHSCWDVPLLV